MTPSQSARELAEKIDKATPGPWVAERLTNHWEVCEPRYGDYFDAFEDPSEETVKAIVAARNEAPVLLRTLADENDRLTGEVERLKRALDQAIECAGGTEAITERITRRGDAHGWQDLEIILREERA